MRSCGEAFGVGQTHGILWRPENVPLAASDGLGWTGLYASAQRESPYAATYGAVPDHLIILHLDGPVNVGRSLGHGREQRRIPAGGLFIMPGGLDFGVRLEDGLESLHLYLRDQVLREVAAEFLPGDPSRLQLIPRLGDQDPHIARLALSIRETLGDAGRFSHLFVDCLARALAARLLCGHSNRVAARESRRPGPRLTRAQLARALDYMQAHLAASPSLDSVAAAAGLSATHFARCFKATVGQAPHQHLLRLRVRRAERMLRDGDLPIARIALACGFSHQEHLTRVFRRVTGATPAAFRRDATT